MSPRDAVREAAARAACRSRCSGRAHICDQDAHGACLPEKCSMWDVLWLDLADDVLTGIEGAGFAVVPVEPSEAMLHAGSQGAACLGTPLTRTASAYRAMVAAR